MIVKKQILNKIFSVLFFTLLICSCSAQKINVNHIVDTYIDYYSSRNKIFNPKETYLLMGVFSENENPQNKVLSISHNCFECQGNVTDKDEVIQYKGYKVVVISDEKENKYFLLKHFKNTILSKTFSVQPFNKNMISDSPVPLNVRFDNKGKIYFFCMGGKTEEIRQLLGFTDTIEDCRK